MLVTPDEFFLKQGEFSHYCPACLYYNNYLINGGPYVDNNGIIQFRHSYYWVCQEHFEQFLATPHKFLYPNNENILPENLPKILDAPEYGYYEDGICLVCFFDKKKLVYGDDDFKLSYKNRIYIFCSEDHQNKFLREPHVYNNLQVNFRNKKPLVLKDLPILGYLEQSAASILCETLMEIERKRPVHPCMSIRKSSLIYLGLLLKYRNPKTPKKFLEIYKNAMKKYKDRCDEINKFINISKIVR